MGKCLFWDSGAANKHIRMQEFCAWRCSTAFRGGGGWDPGTFWEEENGAEGGGPNFRKMSLDGENGSVVAKGWGRSESRVWD